MIKRDPIHEAILQTTDFVGNGVPADVTVTRSRIWGDYRVPSPTGYEAGAYFTDSVIDAIDTAMHVFGGPNRAAGFRVELLEVDYHPVGDGAEVE